MGNSKELNDAAIQRITKHLMGQFKDAEAQAELKNMKPDGINWVKTTEQTLKLLIPKIPSVSVHLKREVPKRLNAAFHVSNLAKHGKAIIEGLPANAFAKVSELKRWINELEDSARTAATLVNNIDSQHVSAEVQRQILASECFGNFATINGKSLYPDIFISAKDYSALPTHTKEKKVDGPCLREANPSNVPDGCELKCNEGTRVKVDAHAPHAGLHLGVTWDLVDGLIEINGVWVAYVRIKDCRECKRNVMATTVKYSFRHNLFISALP